MVKYLSFHNSSSFALSYFFNNVKGQGHSVTHTPCYYLKSKFEILQVLDEHFFNIFLGGEKWVFQLPSIHYSPYNTEIAFKLLTENQNILYKISSVGANHVKIKLQIVLLI
jgi:hypothetical protein